jgi:hypothetical protein
VQAKGIHNIFNKIIENFSNPEKAMLIVVQKASRKPDRLDQIEPPYDILSLK